MDRELIEVGTSLGDQMLLGVTLWLVNNGTLGVGA